MFYFQFLSFRYSDSSAAFFTVNPTEDKKKPSRSNEAEKRSPWATAGVSRMVRAYTARSGSASDEVDGRVASDNNDYVNLVSIQAKFPKSQSHPNKRLDAAPDNVFENNSARIMNDYYVMHNTTMPRHQTIENKDAVSRAKGTWKMLKAAKTKQIPIKAPQSSYASLVSGSSDTLRSSETLQDPSDPRTPSPFNVDEPPHDEPPKLAPVSGKLILDKVSDGFCIILVFSKTSRILIFMQTFYQLKISTNYILPDLNVRIFPVSVFDIPSHYYRTQLIIEVFRLETDLSPPPCRPRDCFLICFVM